MKRLNVFQSRRGGVLVFTLLLVAILSVTAATVLSLVTQRYIAMHQATTWPEAMSAAEAGVDMAMSNLRKQVAAGAFMPSSQTAVPANLGLPTTAIVLPSQSGTARSNLSVKITVEPIAQGSYIWYRITSEGSADYIGPRHNSGGGNWAASGALDQVLRQIRLVKDKDGSVIPRNVSARSHRTIEVIARPVINGTSVVTTTTRDGFGAAGLIGDKSVRLNNQNILVDSYDSSKGTYNSVVNGVTNRAENGGVATNGQLIEAGSAQIHGDVMTNGGTATGVGNVTGEIYNDFYRPLAPVAAPTWTTFNSTPTSISDATTLATSGSSSNPARYKLSSIGMSGNASQILTFTPPASGEGHVEIWVTGDVSIGGNASINIPEKVNVTIYIEGNTDIAGNGISNDNARPKYLRIYGVNPVVEGTRTMKIAGNGGFKASVYAPGHDVEIKGGGNTKPGVSGEEASATYGSIVGKSVFMNGVTKFHYDESLDDTSSSSESNTTSSMAQVLDYIRASWIEKWDYPGFMTSSTGKYRVP